MIEWLEKESGEGRFESAFFRNDESEAEMIVYANIESPDFIECAECCVEAFNRLPESAICEICTKLAECAAAGGLNEEFEQPALETLQDILKYCWFMALYVDMASPEDEIAYIVEGEGDWGEAVGFAVQGDRVIYVGADYLDYMKNA